MINDHSIAELMHRVRKMMSAAILLAEVHYAAVIPRQQANHQQSDQRSATRHLRHDQRAP